MFDRSGRLLPQPDYRAGGSAHRALFLEVFHVLIDQGLWTDELAAARYAEIAPTLGP